MTRAELIEAITEATVHPKFKMTKPSRHGSAPTLYQQQLALVLAKRAKKDKTFSGKLQIIRARIDNALKGKPAGPRSRMFPIHENQITVGRHDPRKLNKRLNSPTGGDSKFRALPPRDRKPLQAPKQLGRRRINEIHAEHPFGGKTTIVRTSNMAPDTWRDKAQGYVYTGKKNPTTLERMVGMERGYSAIDAPMFTHADINSQVRSTVNRKVANIRKAWQGKRVIREDIINAIIESALANAAGGGSKLNVGAADNTTNGVNLASKTPVIGNSTVKTYAAGKASGGGKLGGGFGTQGQGASRFSGGGQKFGSRATAAAGVKDVGYGGRFDGPVGNNGSSSSGASSAGGGQKTSLGGVGRSFSSGSGTASSTGGAQANARTPSPAPKSPATSNSGQSQNKTPAPAPKSQATSNSGQSQSASGGSGSYLKPGGGANNNFKAITPGATANKSANAFSAGEGTSRKVVGVGGGDKTQHNKRDLNPGNISQSQRQAGSNIMHNQAARTGAPNMQRERAFAAGTGGRFAGGGPRPMGGGGSYGGGGSSGHSQSGYRNSSSFNIGGSVGFGGGSSRGRIGANFGSSRTSYGSRSSGW